MITAENTKPRTLELYEVINLAQEAETKEGKVKVLKKHESVPLKDYLRCLFDDRIQFLLPPGKPPYQPSSEESVPTSWHKRNVDLRYIVKGLATAEKLIPFRRENIFIGILESIHPKDAELVVQMVNKNPPESLTKEIVEEAFPNLIPKQ